MANSQNIPENVTSYDTGNKPYKHDVGRGKWSTKWDFYAIALSHCFGFRHFILYFVLSRSNAILLLLSYSLGMITFIIPIYYNQMFMGQFSSSGIVSAFRIAPLFKGIGYVALIMNMLTSSYFMVTAAFPLYIIFESMQTYLPWTHCNNFFNTKYCEKMQPGSFNLTDDYWSFNKSFPVHEYLDYLIHEDDGSQKWYFSWRITLCVLLIWFLVGVVLYKGIEILGKIFRFITIALFVCFVISTIRIFSVEESWEILQKFFHIKFSSFNRIEFLFVSPLLALSAFGAGWGNILTIASYNDFKEDIGKLTMNISIIQMFVFLISCINYMAVDHYLEHHYGFTYLYYFNHDTMSYAFVLYAFFFSHLEWSHFWTIIFFLSLFIGQFSEGVLQILTVLTGIFDEFEYTRIYKKLILGGLVGVLAILSIPFCTTNAFSSVFSLYIITGSLKLLIMFLELMAVVWVYGRLRFQRDVKFMTGKAIASWRVWMMRFLTPILILFAMLFNLFYGLYTISTGFAVIVITIVVLKLFPILAIPGYMIYKIYTATGKISERFKKLCRPNDWYPVDPTEHQNYENYSGNTDMTNELVHVDMETEVEKGEVYLYNYFWHDLNKTIPVIEYLDYLVREEDKSERWYFSWRMALCILLVWFLVGVVLYKGIENLGKIFRFITITLLVCLLILTIRIFCMEESWEILEMIFNIQLSSFNNIEFLIVSPLLAVSAFGTGWGNILTIASYNDFKEDIGKLTINISIIQMFVFLITWINFMAVDHYLEHHYGFRYLYHYQFEKLSYSFTEYAFFFSHLEWPHFWTILFFLCTFLGQFSEGVMQILTVLTGIFDEFEYTRIYKKLILGVLVIVPPMLSIPFCTTISFSTISSLYVLTGALKLMIMFLELMVVVWVYGRLRFQRDAKFMTGKSIASWAVWMMRFLTPILIMVAFTYNLSIAFFSFRWSQGLVLLIISIVFFKILPILSIPSYMMYKIYTATGKISERFKKLCRPNDWYPVDPTEHQNYENYLGHTDMTNELVHVNMETEMVYF